MIGVSPVHADYQSAFCNLAALFNKTSKILFFFQKRQVEIDYFDELRYRLF